MKCRFCSSQNCSLLDSQYEAEKAMQAYAEIESDCGKLAWLAVMKLLFLLSSNFTNKH